MEKKVAVTSSTGMSSLQLQEEGATTLHHWAGLVDGRYPKEVLLQKICEDEAFASAKGRLQECDVLVIDEISMISEYIFQMVEYVCRNIRNPQKYFGGIQVITSGCFKQLAPVPNLGYNDPAHYCLNSIIFKICITHHVHLSEVKRQTNLNLIMSIHELCDGTPSQETNELMRGLSRPLLCDMKPIYLYATNFDVDIHNYDELQHMESDSRVYKSDNTGNGSLGY